MRGFGNLILASAAIALAIGVAKASADTIVYDDFESYGPTGISNFTGFTNLTVTGGTVDYARDPEAGLTTPYGDGMVDLDGSTKDGGILRTPEVALLAGTVLTFEFDASGNQRGGAADDWRFGFVSASTPYVLTDLAWDYGSGLVHGSGPDLSLLAGQSYFRLPPDLASDAPWRHYVFIARLVNDATIGAFVADNGGDNVGVLIDNLRFSATPEPGTWMTLTLGFGLLGATLRRRPRALAA